MDSDGRPLNFTDDGESHKIGFSTAAMRRTFWGSQQSFDSVTDSTAPANNVGQPSAKESWLFGRHDLSKTEAPNRSFSWSSLIHATGVHGGDKYGKLTPVREASPQPGGTLTSNKTLHAFPVSDETDDTILRHNIHKFTSDTTGAIMFSAGGRLDKKDANLPTVVQPEMKSEKELSFLGLPRHLKVTPRDLTLITPSSY